MVIQEVEEDSEDEDDDDHNTDNTDSTDNNDNASVDSALGPLPPLTSASPSASTPTPTPTPTPTLPAAAATLKAQARAAFQLGQYASALALYQQAEGELLEDATMVSHRGTLLTNQATCALKLGQPRRACDACTQALSLDVRNVKVRCSLDARLAGSMPMRPL